MPDGRPKLVCMTMGHRTKAEKEYRESNEQAMYTGITFHESEQVKNNEAAHAVFLWLKKLYKKIQFIDGLDEQMINRYCIESASVGSLERLMEKMESDIDKCETPGEMVQLYKAIAGTLATIHRKKELLLKMEDRLFLNPAARIKSIPKTPPKEKNLSGLAAFMAQRNDGS